MFTVKLGVRKVSGPLVSRVFLVRVLDDENKSSWTSVGLLEMFHLSSWELTGFLTLRRHLGSLA